MNGFDYIIVGAGSAGCVLAARLSENPAHRVLLLEAGPRPKSFWLTAPAGLAMVFRDPRFNWMYDTRPVESLGGRTVYWPRGKTLGGSSAINGMVYRRGHPSDYDGWAERGNPGWGWDDVLPLFRQSEANVHGENAWRGGSGEMAVSDPVIRHPSTESFVAAAGAEGVEVVPDLNAPPYEGIAYQQFTIRKGRRETSYTAFVKPHERRPNLAVRSGVRVRRVVVENGRATGVEVDRGAGVEFIPARREVVLCAGTVASPQLLNLSGIGRGEDLAAIGVTPLVDLRGVGQNLQDHWNAPFVWRVTPGSSYNRSLLGWRKYWQGLRYLLRQDGYLAMGTSAVSAYVRSSPDRKGPDLQLAIRPMTSEFLPDGRVRIDPEPGISGATVLVGPRSRGTIRTVSPDGRVDPAIQPNYLSDPHDVERLLGAMRLMRRICAREPMAGRIVAELTPGAQAQSDEELVQHMKAGGGTSWHPVGTCRMGPHSDPMAVVDPRLRVRGVAGLRVADASIMPQITAGNTHAPSVMIGEKAALMIAQDAAL